MDPYEQTAEDLVSYPARRGASLVWRRVFLALTLLFVLAAVSVSAGLVVHTALNHELANGLFAVLFAVLSGKAALLWLSWSQQPDDGDRTPPANTQQKI